MKTSTLAQGIILMLFSTICFAAMNAIIKVLGSMGYSSMENVFFRAFFMVLTIWSLYALFPLLKPMLPNLKKSNFKAKQKGGVKMLLVRSFCGGFAVCMAYYNFSTIPLGLATAFLQSAPIFIAIFSFFTKNKPTLLPSIAAIIGFIGVLFIANPESSNISIINAICGISGAAAGAIAFLTISNLKQFYTTEAVVLWYGVSMCVVGAFGMLIPIEDMGGFTLPSFVAWILFIATGVSGAIGQWLMTKSYMFAPAGIVAPITYMRIVWSLLLGVALGDSFPSLFASFGIFLIILSGVLIAIPVFMKELKNTLIKK